MKKNILIIGFPNYALINFYDKLLKKKKIDFNFYIITNTIDDKEFFFKFNSLIDEGVIKQFFFVNIDKITNFNFFSTLKSFKSIKKILKKFEKIKIDKIICSDFSHSEVKYLISGLKKNNNNLEIIGFNHHSFKIPESVIQKKSFKFKDLFRLKTNITILKILFLHIVKNIILSIIFFRVVNKNFFVQMNFPLYHQDLNYLMSDKPFEIELYKKNFKKIQTYSISYSLEKNYYRKEKSLLVLLDLIKNEQANKYLVTEYLKNILVLVNKLNLEHIFLKPHPRDFTDNAETLQNSLKEYNIEIIDKNTEVSKMICNYEFVIGAGSSVLTDVINTCKEVKVFGMLNLGNKICRNPNVKVLLGDAYGFKSGIVWIEDFNYFENLSSNEIIQLSISQKSSRSINKEKIILEDNFFEKIN